METTIDRANQNILIVDDDEHMLELMEDLLASDGYNFSSASSGSEALSTFRGGGYDLILLDINLPDANGFELAKQIRSDKVHEIPILFVTGFSDRNDIKTAFEQGGFDYITKPIQKDELLARVEHALVVSQYQDQLKKQVESRTEELEKANHALEKLLDRVQNREQETLSEMHDQIENFIRPYLDELKQRLSGDEVEIVRSIENNVADMLDGNLHALEQLRNHLTTREFEICTYIKRGLTSKEIADILGRSPSTVNNHRQNIREKLDITNDDVQLPEYLNQLE